MSQSAKAVEISSFPRLLYACALFPDLLSRYDFSKSMALWLTDICKVNRLQTVIGTQIYG